MKPDVNTKLANEACAAQNAQAASSTTDCTKASSHVSHNTITAQLRNWLKAGVPPHTLQELVQNINFDLHNKVPHYDDKDTIPMDEILKNVAGCLQQAGDAESAIPSLLDAIGQLSAIARKRYVDTERLIKAEMSATNRRYFLETTIRNIHSRISKLVHPPVTIHDVMVDLRSGKVRRPDLLDIGAYIDRELFNYTNTAF